MHCSCPLEAPLAKEAAMRMLAAAEERLLPELKHDLQAYADYRTGNFEQGRWAELREVRCSQEEGADL
jgi:hypothetical protein